MQYKNIPSTALHQVITQSRYLAIALKPAATSTKMIFIKNQKKLLLKRCNSSETARVDLQGTPHI
jgi:hypothetical protein